jgi:hypothetical protein
MPPVVFEPTISAGERPQTHALDRVATGTGVILISELERNLEMDSRFLEGLRKTTKGLIHNSHSSGGSLNRKLPNKKQLWCPNNYDVRCGVN